MNKFNVLALLFIMYFTFSCKEKEETNIQPQQQEDFKPEASDVPHFDEKNSAKVDWDQLPTELRNAIPLETAKTDPNARVEAAIYSFKYGPFGGYGGAPFYIFPPNYSRLYAMAIRSGSLIDKLVVWYIKSDGTIYTSGGGGSGGTYHLHYFAADEYIYYVAGRSGKYVDRLSFYTNKKSFTYGGTGGNPFYAQVPSGYQLFGFWGRSGSLVDQIGFYIYKR